MVELPPDELSELARLALAYARREDRPALAPAFAFDRRLARIVAQSSEPMLGQIRLAWWRDELRKPVEARAKGDAVLDTLGMHWRGYEAAHGQVVDGWEALLAEAPLPHANALEYAAGRGALFAAIAQHLGHAEVETEADAGGRLWALAELAGHSSQSGDRTLALELARDVPATGILPRRLRPLAVIAGLARRSLRLGGAAMLGDRLSPLAAIRLGMFGR